MGKTIEALCNNVLRVLATSGYTEKGIRKHARTYRVLLEYALEEEADRYSEQLGRQFVADRYGASWDCKRGNNTEYANEKIVHLEKLWHYQQYGTILFSARSGKKPPFVCPTCFEREYEAFSLHLEKHNYSLESRRTILYNVQKFLSFLNTQGIRKLESVTALNIKDFFAVFIDCSVQYLKGIGSRVSVFLGFLHDSGMLEKDLRFLIPKFKHVREAYLPSSCSQEEIQKILEAVDCCNAVGKRDYAMLLLVVRLGLRSVDIRSIKLGDFDWKNHQLRITQSKTGDALTLPLPDDVGWAVIDYIRAGRPKTSEVVLFVRHSPGGGPFSQTNKLDAVLHKYMRRAGIRIPKDQHRGLHSLRSSLARSMLETGAPLPVIAEVLGHRNTQSTSHYLRIDMESLGKCPIDPEVVFDN